MLTDLYVVADAIELLRRNQWRDFIIVDTWANGEFLGCHNESIHDLIVNILVHDQAAHRIADLPAVHENAGEGVVDYWMAAQARRGSKE